MKATMLTMILAITCTGCYSTGYPGYADNSCKVYGPGDIQGPTFGQSQPQSYTMKPLPFNEGYKVEPTRW